MNEEIQHENWIELKINGHKPDKQFEPFFLNVCDFVMLLMNNMTAMVWRYDTVLNPVGEIPCSFAPPQESFKTHFLKGTENEL